MNWQKTARLLIAFGVIVFAGVLVYSFRPRPAPSAEPTLGTTDPKAIVESTGGFTQRFTLNKRDVQVEYARQLTYADGSTRMEQVTVTTVRSGGRTFKVTGAQGELAQGDSLIVLNGDVVLAADDGLEVKTDRATYAKSDGVIRAEGPVTFRRGRTQGSGVGLQYQQESDTLNILSQVVVDVSADPGEGPGGTATHITSGGAQFARNEHLLRFEGRMHAERSGQVIEADLGVAHLTADEDRLEAMELRGNSSVVGAPGAAGGLDRMTGRDIDLKYGADGQTIQHALVTGDAVLSLTGEAGQAGRRIQAETIDMVLAPDGSTLTALTARPHVQFTLPAPAGGAAREIAAQAFESKGTPERGLTNGRFTGDVEYRERGAGRDRTARSAALDVALGSGLAIDEARFSRGVRFEEGTMLATAAAATYVLGPGTLALSGSEPGSPRPHLVNERLTVDANRIDIVLSGPEITAVGAVASELKPAKKEAGKVMPSMLDGDQPVSVSAERLVYDGVAGRATYTGSALLWQGDTSIKGASIALDEKTGDLVSTSVEGRTVVTTSAFDQRDKDGKVTRGRSITTAKDFLYEEALRRATYTGEAHMSGPQGDLTAAKIELYLKPAGDELDRAEGYEAVTLVEKNRKTTGNRMTYYGADQRYVMTGTPVTIVDECGRETVGTTLTFFQATDRIVVDGNQEMRTQTRGGGSNCK